MNATPKGVGSTDGSEDVWSEAMIEPGNNDTIILDSVGVTLRRTSVINVVVEVVLAEDHGEHAQPRRVVHLIQSRTSGRRD